MPNTHRTIFIEPMAPRKPVVGAPCNGCGICCLAQPCPLGIILSRRSQGACDALRWNSDQAVYRCGALSQPLDVLEAALPRYLRGLAPWLAPALARFARRWIAAGQGCDSTLEQVTPPIGPVRPVE